MRRLKYVSILLCAILLCGCGKQSGNSKLSNENKVENTINSQIAQADNKNNTDKEDTAQKKDSGSTEKQTSQFPSLAGSDNAEVDLTQMGSDMVYATVYQMMMEPDNFVGKTVRMRGSYYASWYDATAKYYHYVIVKDAAACCSQGIEFIWGDGTHVYPDEYPADETEVKVTGVFETYTEEGDSNRYCRLKNATFTVIQ